MMKTTAAVCTLAAGICALFMRRLRIFAAGHCAAHPNAGGRHGGGRRVLQRPLGTPFHKPGGPGRVLRPAPTGSEEGALYVHTSPEGIEFVSQSAAWDETGLERLYEELLLNQHGEELYSLSKVIVYPQEDDDALATHEQTSERDAFRLRFPPCPRILRSASSATRALSPSTEETGTRQPNPWRTASAMNTGTIIRFTTCFPASHGNNSTWTANTSGCAVWIRKPWRYSPKTTISTTKTTTVSCLKSQRRTTSC